jgi:hypothetical protein
MSRPADCKSGSDLSARHDLLPALAGAQLVHRSSSWAGGDHSCVRSQTPRLHPRTTGGRLRMAVSWLIGTAGTVADRLGSPLLGPVPSHPTQNNPGDLRRDADPRTPPRLALVGCPARDLSVRLLAPAAAAHLPGTLAGRPGRDRARPAGPRAVSWIRSPGQATTTLPVSARRRRRRA